MDAVQTKGKRRAPADAARERQRIELRYAQDARALFPELRDRLLASRPVIGTKAKIPTTGGRRGRVLVADTEPIYGKPTFRNRIDENGVHV